MMMKKRVVAAALLATGVLGIAGVAMAHHSFAMFDEKKQTMVEGTVTAWNYNNPHVWLMIEAPDASGAMKTWSFEGGGPVRITRQGVTGDTYKKGEKLRVVMSPIRDGRPAGGICFAIKVDGSVSLPNDGACDAETVLTRWKAKGWLATAKHLETHPLED
jgi:hypothetical protein